jgi:hypothetical protein
MKPKVALVAVVGPIGPLVIVAVGPMVSTVHVRDAFAQLPAVSQPRTTTVWRPSPSAVNTTGDVHGVAAPASSMHVNVVAASLEVNANAASVAFVGVGSLGPLTIVTDGAIVSTVHVRDAGDASQFPLG